MQRGKLFFNIIIAITIIALISVITYVCYYHISNYLALKEAEEAVEKFENDVIVVEIGDEPVVEENIQANVENQQPVQNTSTNTNTNTNKTSSNVSYRGYKMIGTIQIPKTSVKAPIVDKVTVQSIAAAVATLYGPGLNEVGNTVLVAHNYRNRNIFF